MSGRYKMKVPILMVTRSYHGRSLNSFIAKTYDTLPVKTE